MSNLKDRANQELKREKEVVEKKVVQPVKEEATYLKDKEKREVEVVKGKSADLKKEAQHKVEAIKDKTVDYAQEAK